MADLSAPGLHNFDITLITRIVQFKYGGIPTSQELPLLILTSFYLTFQLDSSDTSKQENLTSSTPFCTGLGSSLLNLFYCHVAF